MSSQYRFTLSLPQGLHARPAEMIRSTAIRFQSSITLINERNGRRADAKSLLSLLSADCLRLDGCLLEISGPDYQEALESLIKLIQSDLPSCEKKAEPLRTRTQPLRLPRSLRNLEPDCIPARSLADGLAIGKAFFPGSVRVVDLAVQESFTSIGHETERLKQARDRVKGKILLHLESANAEISSILQTHLALLEDQEWFVRLRDAIISGHSAAQAILKVCDGYKSQLQQSTTTYLRERATDVQDITEQLLENLFGNMPVSQMLPEGPTICLADTMTPSELLTMYERQVQGFCLRECGPTSHVVVMARSLGVPIVIADFDPDAMKGGEEIIIDGRRGAVLRNINPAIKRYFEREAFFIHKKQACALASLKEARPATQAPVIIRANIGFREEAVPAHGKGAQGVGLLRTEMLFMNRDEAPDEEEQYQDYAAIASSFHPDPVTIRTLDVGGDKELPYLKIPAEANPFLGYRALRIYDEYSSLIRQQIRAILRVSAHFKVRLLVPMVSCLEEWLNFRASLNAIMQDLEHEGIAFDPRMPVGLMIEVPSIAFALDTIGPHCDFISLGTNDLLQYFLACDRHSEKVSYLYDDLHPAFLRLLHKIVADAHASGLRVGLCGEMGSETEKLPILIGLGVDEISLSCQKIPEVRLAAERLEPKSCAQLASELLNQGTASDVRKFLKAFWGNRGRELIDTSLIALEVDCATREEAIQELVNLLDACGRTRDATELEEDIWQREDVYATQMGYGFAVPHCKSRHITANSIAFIRLQAPIIWGDPCPQAAVDCVVLIAMQEDAAQQHMKVISQLARNVMCEEFRTALRKADHPEAVCSLLKPDLMEN